MGSKHASIHIRCDNSEEVISTLEKKFNKKLAANKQDLLALELLKNIANNTINGILDEGEKAEKQAAFESIMRNASRDIANVEPAVLVVRKHFVSVYWYDHIRSENLEREAIEYSHLCRAPVLGVAVYDDTNFQIYAVSNLKGQAPLQCKGEYFFDYDDISPVAAEEVCNLMHAPFLLVPLEHALSLQDGESMVDSFETGTGILVFMWDDFCKEQNYEVLHQWEGATVYRINS